MVPSFGKVPPTPDPDREPRAAGAGELRQTDSAGEDMLATSPRKMVVGEFITYPL